MNALPPFESTVCLTISRMPLCWSPSNPNPKVFWARFFKTIPRKILKFLDDVVFGVFLGGDKKGASWKSEHRTLSGSESERWCMWGHQINWGKKSNWFYTYLERNQTWLNDCKSMTKLGRYILSVSHTLAMRSNHCSWSFICASSSELSLENMC